MKLVNKSLVSLFVLISSVLFVAIVNCYDTEVWSNLPSSIRPKPPNIIVLMADDLGNIFLLLVFVRIMLNLLICKIYEILQKMMAHQNY